MKTLHLINSQSLLPIIAYLKLQKLDVKSLLYQSGLPVELASKDCKVKAVANYQYWQFISMCQQQLNRPDFGYRLVKEIKLATMKPIFDQVCDKSLSLYDGLNMLVRLMSHISTHASYGLSQQKNGIWLYGSSVEIEEEVLPPLEQISIANMIGFVRYYLGDNWQPSAITLQHKDETNETCKYFPNSLVTDVQTKTGIFIGKVHLGKINYKFTLENLIGNSEIDIDFSDKLYQLLSHYAGLGFPTIDKLSELVGLSLRQIQRRLVKENTSYRDILNKVKFDTACQELTQTNKRIIDISQLLDYTDASHFGRAFRKISGMSPKQYRAIH
ncbi:helix-turn-helix transcriptional regulator [Thalassotalea psychrophila]|uniref:Helix-turn-helix transcriptional regulator n=1 Tax=Thalassotalea psychrophila TaxID=3065647 RepID=A0ABY9TZH7_9GAMM|nr:helix-turn-helix transcriptional regulator [Colwelliaceae bacterium SQ149]